MRPDYKAILLSLCGSAGLADHIGDMAGDIWKVLKDIGMPPPEHVGDLEELATWLGKEHGVKTVWGTLLYDPEDDDGGSDAE